jgi:drug/metabolite transporter (DMT)-like permease
MRRVTGGAAMTSTTTNDREAGNDPNGQRLDLLCADFLRDRGGRLSRSTFGESWSWRFVGTGGRHVLPVGIRQSSLPSGVRWPTVIPSVGAFTATAVAGMIPLALGNYVWDEGFRRGDSHLLAVMAYATPLCSALLLASLGAALLTWNLLAGAVVIVLAGLLSRTDP